MRNLNELIKIYNIDLLKSYDKYTKMFKSNINIENVLPDYYLDEYKEKVEESVNLLKELDNDKMYYDLFNNNKDLLDNLSKAKINVIAYKAFLDIENNETIVSTLKKFKPTKGFSDHIEYNMTKTKSGRLIVCSNSPNILILPSRCRKIFESRFREEGELINVDFISLEPRIIKKLSDGRCPDDIYDDIKDILEDNIDRSVIKKAIISALYGKNNKLENISEEKSQKIYEVVLNYFNLSNILKLANENKCEKFRTNLFGRPLFNLEEEKENIIINNFIQSTAVDVSLMYFKKLFNSLDKDLIKPIFVIHDSIVLDVHKSKIKELEEVVQKGYNCDKLGYFPLNITKFN